MKYYLDHEEAYAKIKARGQFGWGNVATLGELLELRDRGLVEKAVAEAGLEQGARILDLGCGSGPYSFYLARKGFRTVGVDISKTAIAMARELTAQLQLSCEFVEGDFLSAPFEGRFDLIVDSHFLHCIVFDDDRAAVLARIRDLLAPNGVFMLMTMICEGPRTWDGPFEFDSDHVLWLLSDFKRTDESVSGSDGRWKTPQRRVLPTSMQRTEIERAGFSIGHSEIIDYGVQGRANLFALCRRR